MAKAMKSIDITNRPDLVDVAEEVRATGEPHLLRRNDEEVAIITPLTPARAPAESACYAKAQAEQADRGGHRGILRRCGKLGRRWYGYLDREYLRWPWQQQPSAAGTVMYLIDSDWVIDFLKGQPDAATLFRQLLGGGVAIGIITFAEVYEGIYYGRDQTRHETGFHILLRNLPVLGINRSIARRYALVRGDLRARGLLIPQPDILIAATAMYYDLTLVRAIFETSSGYPTLTFTCPSTTATVIIHGSVEGNAAMIRAHVPSLRHNRYRL
jgi:tRNA(fMet)-specific endonuclease VapC